MKLFARLFLAGGLICGLCCFTIHLIGSNHLATPISIEYAKFNPLAILFVWTSTVLLGSASYLYYQRSAILEAFCMAAATIGMLFVAITEMTSGTHEVSLCIAVSMLVGAPLLYSLRDDIGLSDVFFIALNLSLSLMLVILAVFQSRTFGLGMAERVWFFLGFLSTTWMLDVPGLAFDEQPSEIPP